MHVSFTFAEMISHKRSCNRHWSPSSAKLCLANPRSCVAFFHSQVSIVWSHLLSVCSCSNCSRATALQMLLCKIWNYLNINAWCLGHQNSKGATKNVHTVSCQLCTDTLWHLHESEAPSALNWCLLVGSYIIESFYFEQTSTDGFCSRVHYCKYGSVGLSGFENKLYWVCIYHLLLLFMTSWKLAKFLASIYLDPWWIFFFFFVTFEFQVQVLLFSLEGCPTQSYIQKKPFCCTLSSSLL